MHTYHLFPKGPIEIPSNISNHTTYNTEQPFSSSAIILPLIINANSGEFPNYNEPYTWWFDHHTTIQIQEIDHYFHPKMDIGLYFIQQIDIHEPTAQIKILMQSIYTDQFPPLPSLEAQLSRAANYKLKTMDPNFPTEVKHIHAQSTEFQLTKPSESENFEANEYHDIYSGHDTSRIDQYIGRIFRALAMLEDAICSYLNHKCKTDIVCPRKLTLGQHTQQLAAAIKKDPETHHPEICAATEAADTKIRKWRNNMAHSVIRYDAPPQISQEISSDAANQKIVHNHKLANPLLMITSETKAIPLKEHILAQFEGEIIATYATIWAHTQIGEENP